MKSKLIKAIIVDDDPFARLQLKDAMEIIQAPIDVVAMAGSAEKGIAAIQAHNPELVFLDIVMPDLSGFQMLSKLNNIGFRTIFTTSYTQYAIRAIRFNALDYLVKPIDIDELRNAIKRFEEHDHLHENIEQVKTAIENSTVAEPKDEKLILKMQDGIVKTKLKEIVSIEAKSNYSLLKFTNSKNILVSKTLRHFEDRLEGKGFFRAHKSFLVHKMHMKGITNTSTIRLIDDSEIPVSRRRLSALKTWFAS